MNIQQALFHARTLGLDRLDAQLLLLHVLGKHVNERAWLLAHDTDLLPDAAQQLLDAQRQIQQLQAENSELSSKLARWAWYRTAPSVSGALVVGS